MILCTYITWVLLFTASMGIDVIVGHTRKTRFFLTFSALSSISRRFLTARRNTLSMSALKYPNVRRDDSLVDILHGQAVKDAYRWLEQPDSTETQQFVLAQNHLTNSILAKFPHRAALEQRLTQLFDYAKFGSPFRRASYYYYFYNSGLQAQSVLMRVPEADLAPDTNFMGDVFFDPNKLSQDGTAALNTFAFSESGTYFAYGVSYSGSDWVTIKVRPTKAAESADMQHDEIKWAKFTGITWLHDDSGFFYTRYPAPSQADMDAGTETNANTDGMLYFHRLGTQQEQDVLILKDPNNPTHMFGSEVSDDGKYLIVTVTESCDPVNKLYITEIKPGQKMDHQQPAFVKVVDDFKAEYSYITNEGTRFFFKTNLLAPRYRVVTYDLAKPADGFQELIPQAPAPSTDVLESVQCVNQSHLVLVYMRSVRNVISVHELKTGKKLRELDVEIGSVQGMTGRKQDSAVYFKLVSFLNPGVIFRYDFNTKGAVEVFKETKLNVAHFSMDDYETKQVFYPSKDGTPIPMFITARKDIQLDGTNPVLLYGYGGFNISLTPMFSPAWLAFIRYMNGIVCVANIRGGGEFGEEWHKAGSLLKKQNSFDDFQYAAKYLIASKYTQPAKLSINGGSNGGLLMGACLNQAPELWGCVLADVGVLDMLRFHKFTIGHAWKSDYGDPEQKVDFEYLLKYSPYHNAAGTGGDAKKVLPATMLLTSDHDDRVVPLHSYKYIAALQHAHAAASVESGKPLVIRVETKAGHGAGKPTKKRIEEAVDRYSFLALATGTEWIE